MTKQLIDASRFDGDANAVLWRASVGAPEFGQNGRVVRYVFSTPAVGRDMHTVTPGAWQLTNFLRNPVFLWAHDDEQPPIGRVVEIGDVGGVLKGNVEYAERDLNPFADTIYRLVRAGYVNAVSTSWQPLDWTMARDKTRPGGVDFTKVDLLEISQVPIPALPAALAEARSRGIDTGPIYDWAERLLDKGGMILVPRSELEELRRAAKMPKLNRADKKTPDWKVGAARDLPVQDDDSWDGAAAEKSIFEWAGGDDFEPAKARKGFLFYDAANPAERGSYRDPIAHVVDGKLTVPKGAIRAAASRLPQTDVPEEVKKRAAAVLNHYKEKAGIGDDKKDKGKTRDFKSFVRALSPKLKLDRGLWDVANLACILQQLGCIKDYAEFEKAIEGDGSKVPEMLAEALTELADAFLAMADEEVKELLDNAEEDGEEEDESDEIVTVEDRAFIAAAPSNLIRAWRRGIVAARSGKKISAETARQVRAAVADHQAGIEHHRAATKLHKRGIRAMQAMLDDAGVPAEEPDDDETEETGEDNGEKGNDKTARAAAHDPDFEARRAEAAHLAIAPAVAD